MPALEVSPETPPEGTPAPVELSKEPGANAVTVASKETETPATPAGDTKLFAGKYASVEELEKGYTELQTLMRSKEAPKVEETPATPAAPVTPEEGKNPLAAAEISTKAEAEAAGIPFDEVSAEYMEHGELSEATYKSLAGKGLSKVHVDSFIAGQQALAAEITRDIHDSVGGAEAFTEINKWASENLSEAEISAYNEALRSDNRDHAKMVLKGIAASYAQANGSLPNLFKGVLTQQPAGATPYSSRDEYLKDVKSSEYKTNQSFRDTVLKRLAVSDVM